MESNNLNQISIDIPNYSGPLEVLLDLAKTQKVDLAEISITKLANKFLEYIKENYNHIENDMPGDEPAAKSPGIHRYYGDADDLGGVIAIYSYVKIK